MSENKKVSSKTLKFPEFPFIAPYVFEEYAITKKKKIELSQWIRDVLQWYEGLVTELQKQGKTRRELKILFDKMKKTTNFYDIVEANKFKTECARKFIPLDLVLVLLDAKEIKQTLRKLDSSLEKRVKHELSKL